MVKCQLTLTRNRRKDMNVYVVVHNYDVDGGIGDAIPKEDIVVITDTKEKAVNFIKNYSNYHTWEVPYDVL